MKWQMWQHRKSVQKDQFKTSLTIKEMPSVVVKANREYNKGKDYGELCISDLEWLPHS